MIDEKKLAEWEEHVRILRGFYPTASDDVALTLIAEVRRQAARIAELESRSCQECAERDDCEIMVAVGLGGCCSYYMQEEAGDD